MQPELSAISPLDGRYREAAKRLAPCMSEYGLIRNRVAVEVAYFLALADEKDIPLTLTKPEEDIVARIAALSESDAALVKQIETEGALGRPATRHDVKAVEYFIKERFKGTTLEDKGEWVHFGLTSEDVNNIAYALMLREGTEALLATLDTLVVRLESLANDYASTAMLARTHGQPASPTTFGKEMRVFAARLKRECDTLASSRILAKLNGATGNYHALAYAYPSIDWPKFSERFIASLNVEKQGIMLVANPYTTQIESHDSYVSLFQTLHRVNSILTGFNQDMWRYISDGWVKQKPKAGEVGSSTMPHKVNPIDFEQSEGNLGIANSLLEHFARKLPISRMQRDLSDSTVERNFGVAFAYSLIAYEATLRGLARVEPNPVAMADALEQHPEVIAEAIQTILRREGQADAYEKLRDLTRGADMTMEGLRGFVKGLIIDEPTKLELLALTPATYLGLAERLARGE